MAFTIKAGALLMILATPFSALFGKIPHWPCDLSYGGYHVPGYYMFVIGATMLAQDLYYTQPYTPWLAPSCVSLVALAVINAEEPRTLVVHTTLAALAELCIMRHAYLSPNYESVVCLKYIYCAILALFVGTCVTGFCLLLNDAVRSLVLNGDPFKAVEVVKRLFLDPQHFYYLKRFKAVCQWFMLYHIYRLVAHQKGA